MYVFKEINKSSTVIDSNIVHYTQNLSSSADGIQSIKIVSGSTNSRYWQSLNVLFYTSGSPQYGDEHKFGRPSSNLSIQPRVGEQYLTKYHGYSNTSLITIPQHYYGEKIKEGSFQFTDISGSNVDSDGNNPIIKDDGKGNLYSTNANLNFGTLTASSAGTDNSISSSKNYVGNIFYDKGLAIITETGSWSGSVNYSDLATNYMLKFESYNTITTHEYSITLEPQEFNLTTNYTIRSPLSGSSESLSLSTSTLAAEFTSSDFQPYITTINLFQKGDYDTPLIQATLPRPIRKSDKINMRFKIKLDI